MAYSFDDFAAFTGYTVTIGGFAVASGAVHGTGATNVAFKTTPVCTTVNQRARIKYASVPTGSTVYIVLRGNTTGLLSGYVMAIQTDGTMSTGFFASGTPTTIGSFNSSAAPIIGDEYEFEVEGNATIGIFLYVYKNGVLIERVQDTGNTFTVAGTQGFALFNAVDSLDLFEVQDLDRAGGIATVTPMFGASHTSVVDKLSGAAKVTPILGAAHTQVVDKLSVAGTITPMTGAGHTQVVDKLSVAGTITPMLGASHLSTPERLQGVATLTPVMGLGTLQAELHMLVSTFLPPLMGAAHLQTPASLSGVATLTPLIGHGALEHFDDSTIAGVFTPVMGHGTLIVVVPGNGITGVAILTPLMGLGTIENIVRSTIGAIMPPVIGHGTLDALLRLTGVGILTPMMAASAVRALIRAQSQGTLTPIVGHAVLQVPAPEGLIPARRFTSLIWIIQPRRSLYFLDTVYPAMPLGPFRFKEGNPLYRFQLKAGDVPDPMTSVLEARWTVRKQVGSAPLIDNALLTLEDSALAIFHYAPGVDEHLPPGEYYAEAFVTFSDGRPPQHYPHPSGFAKIIVSEALHVPTPA